MKNIVQPLKVFIIIYYKINFKHKNKKYILLKVRVVYQTIHLKNFEIKIKKKLNHFKLYSLKKTHYQHKHTKIHLKMKRLQIQLTNLNEKYLLLPN